MYYNKKDETIMEAAHEPIVTNALPGEFFNAQVNDDCLAVAHTP